MAADLRKHIARLKTMASNSDLLASELKQAAQESGDPKERRAREEEARRQIQTSSNLKYSIAEMEKALKTSK